MSTLEDLEFPNLKPIRKSESALFFLGPLSNDTLSISSVESKPSFFQAVNKNITTQMDVIRKLNDGSYFDKELKSSTNQQVNPNFERKQLLMHRSKVFSYFPTNTDHLPRVSTFRSEPKKNECHLLPELPGSIAKLSSIFPCSQNMHLTSTIMPSLRAKSSKTHKNTNMFVPLLIKREDSTLNSTSQDETIRDTDGIYFIQSFKYLNK